MNLFIFSRLMSEYSCVIIFLISANPENISAFSESKNFKVKVWSASLGLNL